jgi:hypothetical protein
MSEDLSFKIVRSNGTDEVLARAVNLLIARGAYRRRAGAPDWLTGRARAAPGGVGVAAIAFPISLLQFRFCPKRRELSLQLLCPQGVLGGGLGELTIAFSAFRTEPGEFALQPLCPQGVLGGGLGELTIVFLEFTGTL